MILQGRTPAERAENGRASLCILDGLIAVLAVALVHELGTLAGWW